MAGLGLAALPLAGAAYLGLTVQRNRDWKDETSLVAASLRACPQSARLHHAMGRLLSADKKWPQAIAEYRLALSIELYDDPSAMRRWRGIEPVSNELLAWAAESRRTLQVRVDRAAAFYNIGSAYLNLGRSRRESAESSENTRKAVGYLELAKTLDQSNVGTLNNLAAAQAQAGQLEAAIGQLREALVSDPASRQAGRNLETFQEQLAASLAQRLRAEFPALQGKWEGLKSVSYRRTSAGLEADRGSSGSSQESLKPEERQALEALALRAGDEKPTVFPAIYGKSYGLSFGSAGVEVEPLGGFPAPARAGAGLVFYPAVYPDATVFLSASQGRVEEFYYLASAKAPRSFRQKLRPLGQAKSFRIGAGGNLEAVDEAGRTVLELSRPVVLDQAGRELQGRFSLESQKDARAGGNEAVLALSFEARDLRYPLLIDPAWTAPGDPSMSYARAGHSVTLLPNGKVLVAGGYDAGGNSLKTAELYDPATGTWATTGDMNYARHYHISMLLPNGKVLVAAGFRTGADRLSSAELYDPATGIWTETGVMNAKRQRASATLLPDGRVLVTGGYDGGALNSAELYANGTWTTTNPMFAGREQHTATLLPNGKVLVAGGTGLSSAELYDPAGGGTWSTTNPMSTVRRAHTATLLPNGKVLAAAGWSGSELNSAELYDPGTGSWGSVSALSQARDNHVAALLPNGKV
ncbi:MAG TPA: hypothetical protein DEB40_05535, partial [Elusimicrobia bacterium]|nr:hypothetical protein [Elusimicrobiota bacterium]